MTIHELQQQVKELKAAQGWSDLPLERRIIFLFSEVGELAKEVLKLVNTATTDKAAIKTALGLEIYDIVWNLCDLANLAEIDLEAAFAQKEALNRLRKWEG